MEANEAQKLHIADHKSSFQFLKRTLQLLVSVSLLSLLFCYSFFPHFFNACYSTMLFSVFTHAIDRKYMFLVCNGILVFLAKSSSSSSTTSSPPSFDFGAKSSPTQDQIKTSSADLQQVVVHHQLNDGNVVVVAEHQEEPTEEEAAIDDQTELDERGGEEVSLYAKSEEVEENESEDLFGGEEVEGIDENWAVVKQEIERMDEPSALNEELLSTDELNKKVEEFIRKMKEEIRIEAQQQLIAV